MNPQEIETAELAKYTQLWGRVPAYRNVCPGESQVEAFVQMFEPHQGDTVLDFGCGTGRAAKALQDRGFGAIGVDFAENCLDPGIDVPFERACLWRLPRALRADFGFCCDVLEHIPERFVARALRCMSAAVRDGLYLLVDTSPDQFGATIGETLHVTVKPAAWWAEQVERNVTCKRRVLQCR